MIGEKKGDGNTVCRMCLQLLKENRTLGGANR